MSDLIKTFSAYSDFEPIAYYTVSFESMPSNLSLKVPLKAVKKNMEAVLAAIALDEQQLQPVLKNWNTEDASNSDFSKDFPYQYLFKSETKKLVVWIALDYDELEVDFYYDVTDPALEEWVIATNHHLRITFGEEKSPEFKVLSRERNKFVTEEVKTKPFELDVEGFYNDDFQEVDEVIVDSMSKDMSGLILLHGKPGTGKTSYIKNLITDFKDKSFIFVQNEFINQLLLPDFISFLLDNKNSVLIIEDAEKVITSRDYTNESSVVSTILQLTDGLFSDYLNIKIICTFNTSIDRIDKALLRKGRMIANYEFDTLTEDKADKILLSLGQEAQGKRMVLADIFNYHQRLGEETKEESRIGF